MLVSTRHPHYCVHCGCEFNDDFLEFASFFIRMFCTIVFFLFLWARLDFLNRHTVTLHVLYSHCRWSLFPSLSIIIILSLRFHANCRKKSLLINRSMNEGKQSQEGKVTSRWDLAAIALKPRENTTSISIVLRGNLSEIYRTSYHNQHTQYKF